MTDDKDALLRKALRSINFAQSVAKTCGPKARQDEILEHLRVAEARITAALEGGKDGDDQPTMDYAETMEYAKRMGLKTDFPL